MFWTLSMRMQECYMYVLSLERLISYKQTEWYNDEKTYVVWNVIPCILVKLNRSFEKRLEFSFILFPCFALYSTLKKEEMCSFESSFDFPRTARFTPQNTELFINMVTRSSNLTQLWMNVPLSVKMIRRLFIDSASTTRNYAEFIVCNVSFIVYVALCAVFVWACCDILCDICIFVWCVLL
jgi:hypothetical protein